MNPLQIREVIYDGFRKQSRILFVALVGLFEMLLWLVVILGVSNVACFDENLRRHSVVYGISTLARGNDTECAWQLREFLDGVDKKHLWALKGKVVKFGEMHTFLIKVSNYLKLSI